MSNLLNLPIPLLPFPKKVQAFEEKWQEDSRWGAFEWTDPAGVQTRAWAESEAEARLVASELPELSPVSPEAYSAVFHQQGVAARATKAEGWQRFESTRDQMRTLSRQEEGVRTCRMADWPDMEIRGVHLDMKYFMHQPEYLLGEWLEELKRYKINTLLLEYEDKFPFRLYPELAAPDVLTPEELTEFLSRLRAAGIRVVPLFQTLGHWEFILRHERFKHLRSGDDGEYHTEVPPNHPEALAMIYELIDEILAYHQEDEWFHIGGDEPWYLRKLYREDKDLLGQTFGTHMGKVCDHLLSRGKRPLLYDDVFRGVSKEGMANVLGKLPTSTILCFWDYSAGISWPNPASVESLAFYREAGFDLLCLPCHNWGALTPYYADHTSPNTVAMILMARKFGALGIINTAWACFRVPMPLSDFGLAVTGSRSWNVTNDVDLIPEELFFSRLKFGLRDRRLLTALQQVSLQLEFPAPYGRPFGLAHYFYMDAVVQYGSHEVREKLGSSLDLYDNADHRRIVRDKVALLNDSPDRINGIEGLRWQMAQAEAALQLIASIQEEITPEAWPFLRLLTWTARFKEYASRRMLALVDNTVDAFPQLLKEGKALEQEYRLATESFLVGREIDREIGYQFKGEEAVMNEALAVMPASVGV